MTLIVYQLRYLEWRFFSWWTRSALYNYGLNLINLYLTNSCVYTLCVIYLKLFDTIKLITRTSRFLALVSDVSF